jgi:hypothetical protein
MRIDKQAAHSYITRKKLFSNHATDFIRAGWIVRINFLGKAVACLLIGETRM